MKAAVIQMPVHPENPPANREQAALMLREAADKGARLVVLPELWTCGFCLDKLADVAETMRGETVNFLRQLARMHNLFIIGGSIPEKKDGKFFNTSVAINEEGEIIAKYRKTHLYPHGLHEADYFAAGDEWTFATCHNLELGLTVCYDIYFPEFIRNLCLRGAQILTAPVCVCHEAIDEFSILAKARAVENHCFLLMANVADNAGQSLIISPRGRILARGDAKPQVLLADLDLTIMQHLRQDRNALNDRRNILDEIDNSQI